MQGCSQASCSASPGKAADLPAEGPVQDLCIILHAPFQLLQLPEACPLLPAKGIDGSLFSAKGRLHVAHDRKAGAPYLRHKTGEIHSVHLPEIGSDALKLLPLPVQEADPQGVHAAHASVIGGGAADGDGDVPGSRQKGLPDQLPRPIGGGKEGVAFLRRHQGKS